MAATLSIGRPHTGGSVKQQKAQAATTVVGYVRVSRVGGRKAEQFHSPALQRRRIEQLAEAHGLTVGYWFEDLDRSGANPLREGWVGAMGLVTERLAGGVIVATIDRFSRDTQQGLAALAMFIESEAQLITGDVGVVDLSTPEGRFMATTYLNNATLDRDRKKVQLMGTRKDAIEGGTHLAIPFGYQRKGGWVQTEDSEIRVPARRGAPLTPDPREAPVVQLAFQLRAEGLSWAAIARRLNDNAVMPRPRRAKGQVRHSKWAATTVAHMVGQEVYRGVAHSGEYRREGAHEAIIGKALWAEAHKSAGAKFKSYGNEYLLTGLIRCAGCGHTMTRIVKRNARQGSWSYYVCRTDSCEAKATAKVEDLEAWVLDRFHRDLGEVHMVGIADGDDEVGTAIAALDQAQADYDTKVENWLALPAGDADLRRAAQRAVDQAKATLEAARREVTRARAATQQVNLPEGFTLEGFADLEVAEQRHLLSTFYAMVAVRRASTPGAALDGRVQTVIRSEQVPSDKYGLVDLAKLLDW